MDDENDKIEKKTDDRPFVRNPGGLFAKGTKAGPGNPNIRKLNAFRNAWRSAFSEQDIHEVLLKLKEAAFAGERWAIEQVLDREFGKPRQIIEQETTTIVTADEARRVVQKFFGGN